MHLFTLVTAIFYHCFVLEEPSEACTLYHFIRDRLWPSNRIDIRTHNNQSQPMKEIYSANQQWAFISLFGKDAFYRVRYILWVSRLICSSSCLKLSYENNFLIYIYKYLAHCPYLARVFICSVLFYAFSLWVNHWLWKHSESSVIWARNLSCS